MDGAYSTDGNDDKCINTSVGKHKCELSLGTPRCEWDDNIKMDLETWDLRTQN
jgi:hypothetical protein